MDSFLNETLFDALNEFAPPYFYFGAHEGDGSDYGFWLTDEALEDFDGLKVSDTSEVPADYTGEVLQVNERGNTTLYGADNGTTNHVDSCPLSRQTCRYCAEKMYIIVSTHV